MSRVTVGRSGLLHRVACAVLAAVAVAVASTAHAQSATRSAARLRLLAFGDTVVEPRGAPVVVYGLPVLAGSRVSAGVRAGARDTIELAFLTPAGEEIVSARGAEVVSLDMIAPLDDAFLLAVTRADSTRSFRLSLGGTDPSAYEHHAWYGLGFEIVSATAGTVVRRECWMDPGRRWRAAFPAGGSNPLTSSPAVARRRHFGTWAPGSVVDTFELADGRREFGGEAQLNREAYGWNGSLGSGERIGRWYAYRCP